MTVQWNGYEPYVPPVRGPLQELTREEAVEAYEHLMASRAERIEKLRALLRKNGIQLTADDAGIQQLNDWFRENVHCSDDDPVRLASVWYAVVIDVALFLGDVIVARCPGARWDMFTAVKKDVAYQRPVLVGFTKAPNPRFNIDVDRLVATYAHQAAGGSPVASDYFVTMIRAAVARV